jgi:hypothetical protein
MTRRGAAFQISAKRYQEEFTQVPKKKPGQEELVVVPEKMKKADYLRQKGLRYAEIVQIEYYNQQLKTSLGDDKWNKARQDEFARQLKALIRSPYNGRRVAVGVDEE